MRQLQYDRKPEPEFYTGNASMLYAYRMNSYTPSSEELLAHARLGHPCQRYMLEMVRKKTLRSATQAKRSQLHCGHRHLWLLL
jgi:hypothetical protein